MWRACAAQARCRCCAGRCRRWRSARGGATSQRLATSGRSSTSRSSRSRRSRRASSRVTRSRARASSPSPSIPSPTRWSAFPAFPALPAVSGVSRGFWAFPAVSGRFPAAPLGGSLNVPSSEEVLCARLRSRSPPPSLPFPLPLTLLYSDRGRGAWRRRAALLRPRRQGALAPRRRRASLRLHAGRRGGRRPRPAPAGDPPPRPRAPAPPRPRAPAPAAPSASDACEHWSHCA